jgi:hypothetical protein
LLTFCQHNLWQELIFFLSFCRSFYLLLLPNKVWVITTLYTARLNLSFCSWTPTDFTHL